MVGQQGAGLAAFYCHLQPELDEPADGLGAIGRVVLSTGPGIHTFPHFVRQPDCSNRVLAGGGAFFYVKKVAKRSVFGTDAHDVASSRFGSKYGSLFGRLIAYPLKMSP
jgi:hypothetical protein